MKAPKKASTALRRAARILRRRGWRQGWPGDATGPCCSEGALNLACGSSLARDRPGTAIGLVARETLLSVLGHTGTAESEIWQWNDDLKRTRGEVLRAFERAAKLAEKAEATR